MSARVLITGASGGIGAAAVAELRARGAQVVGLDLEADEAAGVLACDVRDPAAVERGVEEAVRRLGGLDVVINNAGLGIPQSAGRAPDHGALAVTTVYPGYIRTGIHLASTQSGVGLEGAVPAERVEDAARALARAALGRPVRDLATTRAGALQYFLARRSPRRLLDRITNRAVRRMVRSGRFTEGGLGRDLATRLSRARAGRRLAPMARDGWSALFTAAFKQSKNPMALVDEDRRHVDVNPAYLRLLGRPRDALIGRPIYEHVAGGPIFTAAQWAGRAQGRALPRHRRR